MSVKCGSEEGFIRADADCFSLPNAVELVEELRCFSVNRFNCDYKCLISTVDKAADAIEALASADGSVNDRLYCKYREDDGQCHHRCMFCSSDWGWEWRGVNHD